MKYDWYHLNVFTRWIKSTRQIIVLVVDANPSIIVKIETIIRHRLRAEFLSNPFWIYTCLVEIVVDLQDKAVWSTRNLVRETEKGRTPKEKPQPDYPYLHDLSRHTIHVSETLDLALVTADSMLSYHDRLMGVLTFDSGPEAPMDWVRNRLLYFQHMLRSLHLRSGSNKERLQNEINLAFNIVAQYDARTSVDISRSTQSDSAAMKSIAFVTLAFLPATFICAVFSMSFFSYNADSGSWSVSDKFWIYWAISIPVTVFTALFWGFWNRYLLPFLQGDDKEYRRARESIARTTNDIKMVKLRGRNISGNQGRHLLV
jgi:hypothetical protein